MPVAVSRTPVAAFKLPVVARRGLVVGGRSLAADVGRLAAGGDALAAGREMSNAVRAANCVRSFGPVVAVAADSVCCSILNFAPAPVATDPGARFATELRTTFCNAPGIFVNALDAS